MSWLTYADDEVSRFHPEFFSAANQALQIVGIDSTHEWIHHNRTPGNTLIPDFVLRRKDSKQWLVALEVKRRRDSVYSTRNQIQAQGYALTNQYLYSPTAPKYFAISNLEVTILCALNGERPPRECRIQNGTFNSGDFRTQPSAVHKQNLINDLAKIVRVVTSSQRPSFDTVWPSILSDFMSYAESLPFHTQLIISEPDTPNWPTIRDFFALPIEKVSTLIFFMRCLLAEYLRGALIRHNHPRARRIPAARIDPDSIASTIAALKQIDFSLLFEPTAPTLYRTINDATLRDALRQYLTLLTDPSRKVVDLASSRVDAPELLDSLMTSLYPPEIQDQRGKIQTDPELAAILARLTINKPVELVLDPCCGDGMLLSAAYDLLMDLGMDNTRALSALAGVEADAVGVRLAETRLALKQPASLSTNTQVKILYGDMFAHANVIAQSQAIVMNPPFMRYEEQQGRRVPQMLRTHYNNAIQYVSSSTPSTTRSQANLYNYYVEFIVKSASPDTVMGIILDNKWYHNKYGIPLKDLLLKYCHIIGIIEYPHSYFFAKWTIATSIVIIQRKTTLDDEHTVKFVRSKVDPRSVDLRELADAFHRNGEWPNDWSCRVQSQKELKAQEGWKSYFANELQYDYRGADWPALENLFAYSRRGSLEKEGGGTEILEFPFGRSDYGPKRLPKPGRVGYQTLKGRELSDAENARLRDLASSIPAEYVGWVLRNSDDPEHYELTEQDVQRQQTLEPPRLRRDYHLFLDGRTEWSAEHDAAVADMRNEPRVAEFITEIERVVNLTDAVLPNNLLWNVLREPVAGELIIPRKTRIGHWVHINPFAFDLTKRQVRISSNFITYSQCTAVDSESGLTRELATHLIAAFLVSSFGQLQFEVQGYNREGLLAVEKHHLRRIKIFDPRWIRREKRQAILDAFSALPYKIATNKLSWEHPERNTLDELFAQEIVNKLDRFDVDALLEEMHTALDEWLVARQP